MNHTPGILSVATALLTSFACSCTTESAPDADKVPVSVIQDTSITKLHFSVEEAPEWTTLFKRQSGWFGADGIFAIPLNGVDTAGAAADTTTLLLFSDSLIGEIRDGVLKAGDYKMINNTVAIIEGVEPSEENITFFWDKDSSGNPKAIFVPNTPDTQPGDYYWLGDGFVNTEKHHDTYLFGYRIRNTGAATFGFQEVGNTLIIIPAGSRPPFRDQRQIDTPLFLTGNSESDYGSFGAGVFVNTREAGVPHPDGYIYVYGLRGKAKNVMVARVEPANIEDFSRWRYWDGSSWNADINQVASITDQASNEMSVTPLPDGRYAMVFQTGGIGKTVGLRLGLSPQGPFGPIITLWDCSEAIKMDKDFITYNAKVHSNLSRPGELLISYNVNSFDFFKDILVYPNLYRPRFIRVKLHE